jgi:hypothetical protein
LLPRPRPENQPKQYAPLYQINWALPRLLKKLDDAIFPHFASRRSPSPHPRCQLAAAVSTALPTCHAASTVLASLLAVAGVWPLADAAGWPGQPSSSRAGALDVACGPTTRRRCRRWPAPGKAQAQLPAAKQRHHPRPRLAGTGRSPLCSTSCGRMVKNTDCQRIFQVFQMFQRYVASVLDGCCKCRSGCIGV